MSNVGDHYRPTTDDYEPGVYRVVGVIDDVTLLRVTDADGRRAHTGHLRHVPPSTLASDIESAPDPDAAISPVSSTRNLLDGLYWSVRQFL